MTSELLTASHSIATQQISLVRKVQRPVVMNKITALASAGC